MKQLFLEKGTVKPFEVPTPQVDPNKILVKVAYSCISTGTEGATVRESKKTILQKCLSNTTDKVTKVMGAVKDNGIMGTVALIKGALGKISSIGYSCSGQVVSVGSNINSVKPGDFVACAGSCIANHAQYVSVPKHLAVKLPTNTDLKRASLTTIGAIAMQGVRRAQLSLGEHVCVIGLGLIGQLTVQLAKRAGCTVYGVDIDDSKLFLAQKFRCDHVYNSRDGNLLELVPFQTHHHGVDATIITAGSQDGTIIQQAMELTRRKGKVVLVGDVALDFNRSPFYEKEIDFLISCSYGPGRYDAAYEQAGNDYPYSYVRWTENRNMQLFAKLVQEGTIDVDPLVSQEFSFDKAEKAYEYLLEKKSLGLILNYQTDTEKKGEHEVTIQPSTDIATELDDQPIAIAKTRTQVSSTQVSSTQVSPTQHPCIAVIGAGGFAKIKLLPLVAKIKDVTIHTIIDTDTANALSVAKQYGAQDHHNDYRSILQNDEINTVIIATPHALHTQQAIACMKAGKAVFVEKPAAVNESQYKQLKLFLHENPNALYCVDFNRSFAPFMIKIKQALANRTTPLIAHYRMNAGFISKEHWIQSQTHGGRIVGEACHIFELFQFLTDAKPIRIGVQSIDTTRDDLLCNDNFSTQISFEDGSICTLLYTAMGNAALPKERMELFWDGKSIVMDDYKQVTCYGISKTCNQKTKHQDKGHAALLTQFMQATQGIAEPPLSAARILQATKLSLDHEKAINRRTNF